MEVFADFGVFELLAVAGLAIAAKTIYARRWRGLAFLVLSLIAPIALVFTTHERLVRWIALGCVATSLVNASLIFSHIRRCLQL